MAHLHRTLGDTQQAIYYYLRYLENNPYDYDQYNYLGMAYDDIGEEDEGVNCYKKSLELNP